MKVCPQCNSSYDDSMFFCLEDGTPLKSPNDSNLEQTLVLPTKENYSISQTTKENEYNLTSSFEETLTLPKKFPTQNAETEDWKASVKTNENSINNPVTNYSNFNEIKNTESNISNKKGIFIILGVLLSGLILSISGYIGWRLSQSSSPKNEVAVITNSNKTSNLETNSNLVNANNEISVSSDEDNSNLSNENIYNKPNNSETPSNNNTVTPTPKPSPTRTTSPTPNQPPTPSVTPTLTPKTPKPSPPKTPSDTVNGGVLNGRAVFLYQPVYPPDAKANKIGGSVSVQVLVDESGKVVSANAVNGHNLLKQPSEKAALSSRFTPAKVNGQPVKVTGIIVYRFVP